MRRQMLHVAVSPRGVELQFSRWVAWPMMIAAAIALGLAVNPLAAQTTDDAAPAAKDAAEKAAEKPANDESAPSADSAPADELSLAEEQIRGKYQRFEQVLLRMSELTAASDPKRAALLRKAVGESKDKLIGLQFDRLVEALKQERLANAVSQQSTLEQDLGGLLELLLTEQRGQQLKDERERIKAQIRELKELINKQQQLQGQTAGNADPKALEQGQDKLAKQTGKLAEQMEKAENESKAGKPGESNDQQGESPAEGKEGDESEGKDSKKGGESGKQAGDKKEPQPGEQGKPEPKEPEPKGEGEKGDKSDKSPEGKESPQGDQEKKEGQEGRPAEGSQQKSPPGQGQGQQGQGEEQEQEPSQQSPSEPSAQESARQRVQAAQQRMDEAKKKLEKAQREGAIADQEQAVRELELAKAKLEEILRQLREEELQRTLALLEARFRKMLELQVEVHDGTKLLSDQKTDDRDRNDEIEAGRLSRKEALIVVEVDAALTVLREEGSSVAFPEAIGQMREDMEQVVLRLSQAKADEITVGIEEEIIAALEEMIAALEKAQKDQQEKQQQQQQQADESQEPPLVDAIAELKMIRSLQMRVNNRTARYAKMVEGEEGQAEKAELIEALQKLSERETRIFKTTRDIVLGKNK